jgi:hypothetical protein
VRGHSKTNAVHGKALTACNGKKLEVVVPVEPGALQRLDRQLGVFRSAQTLAGGLPHAVLVTV